jgi:diphthamide biosynthesis protein 2
MDHWSYDPTSSVISTGVPAFVKRQLNRRFYLTQKARESTIIGILVGSMSQRHSRTIVSHLQQLIEASGRACYTVAVGKINVAKLANFAEVDCFVLVACGENSILDQERDYHLPIVTPLELEIALGQKDWSLAEYSLDYNDVLLNVTPTKDAENNTGTKQTTTQDGFSSEQDDDDDGDEPYFSLVTGRYESSKRTAHTVPEDLNLAALPGQGQITAYESAGAEFLAKREYRGLQADVGVEEAKAAVEGSTGIASDYGHR